MSISRILAISVFAALTLVIGTLIGELMIASHTSPRATITTDPTTQTDALGEFQRLGAIGDALSGAASFVSVIAVVFAGLALFQQVKSSREQDQDTKSALSNLADAIRALDGIVTRMSQLNETTATAINQMADANVLTARMSALSAAQLADELDLVKLNQLIRDLESYVETTGRQTTAMHHAESRMQPASKTIDRSGERE